VTQRLVADGELLLDGPAKLSARARVLATGQGRKTDPVDAHPRLRQVIVDDTTASLRMLVDRPGDDWISAFPQRRADPRRYSMSFSAAPVAPWTAAPFAAHW
jgi:hypothetical protein